MHGTDYKDIKLDNQSTFLKNRADGGYSQHYKSICMLQ